MVIDAARGLMVQGQGSKSFLGPATYYHSSREGSSIILPDLVLRQGPGRSESDQRVTFPGTRLAPLCLITPMYWMNL